MKKEEPENSCNSYAWFHRSSPPMGQLPEKKEDREERKKDRKRTKQNKSGIQEDEKN